MTFQNWDCKESPEHLLKRAYLAMRGRSDALLSELGLTLPQAEVLTHLWQGEILCLRDLGERLGTQPATLKGILDGLERRGLVTREEDPSDARVKRLHLTLEGERLQARVPVICSSVQDWALRGLDSDEIGALKKALHRIVRNLDANEPATPLASPLWETV